MGENTHSTSLFTCPFVLRGLAWAEDRSTSRTTVCLLGAHEASLDLCSDCRYAGGVIKEPTGRELFRLKHARGVKWKRRKNGILSFAVFHVNSHAIKSVYEFILDFKMVNM